MTIFANILNEFRDAARSKFEQGNRFERLIMSFLGYDSQYVHFFSVIWLWSEWPDHVKDFG